MATPEEMRSGVRYGLIGCGDIGRLRADAIRASRNDRLVAASDTDASRSAAIATKHGATSTGDWRQLLENPEVDAVVVSTPPSVHAEMCIAALEAGKHVLCEKPLARTPEECRAMVKAAEANGRVLATGFNYRFYPSFQQAKQLFDAGEIGNLSHIRSYGGYSATSHNQPWVHQAEVVGGGALHDIGIHLIDLTRLFLGEVAEASGYASGLVWQYPETEDNGFVLMRSTEGKVATLQASWTEWGPYQFVIELVGDRGRILASCFPMNLEVIRMDPTLRRPRRRRYRFPSVFVGEHLRSYRWVVVNSFVLEFEAFAQAVRGEPSPIATGYDGLRAVEIACAVSRPGGEYVGTSAPKRETAEALA